MQDEAFNLESEKALDENEKGEGRDAGLVPYVIR